MSQRRRRTDISESRTWDSWISVSDLMAALMFVFIIILTVYALQFRVEQETLLEARDELREPALTRQEILTKLQRHLQRQGLQVTTLPEEGILRLSEEALKFPSGHAYPDRGTLPTIGILATALSEYLPCFSEAYAAPQPERRRPRWCSTSAVPSRSLTCPRGGRARIETVMIEGHTDSTAIRPGTVFKDNLALSAARATTVLRLLAMCNPSLPHLHNSQSLPLLGVGGYSYMRPIVKNRPADPGNRRIDIRLVMELPEVALHRDSRSTSQASPQAHVNKFR